MCQSVLFGMLFPVAGTPPPSCVLGHGLLRLQGSLPHGDLFGYPSLSGRVSFFSLTSRLLHTIINIQEINGIYFPRCVPDQTGPRPFFIFLHIMPSLMY